MNLMTNGLAGTGDNTNFSQMTLVTSDSPAGGGCFHLSPTGVAATVMSDELIPVDPNLTYQLNFQARQAGASTDDYFYAGLASYDVDQLLIDPSMYSYIPSTLTTLAAQLNPGATTMTLTSSANWTAAAGTYSNRYIIFWNYRDGKGKLWAPNTYSRNTITGGSPNGGYTSISGNVVTLAVPYAGTAMPAGTSVSNGSGGGTYKYIAAAGVAVPHTWTSYVGTIGDLVNDGSQPGNQFKQGTAYEKILALANRIASGANDTDGDHRFGALRLTEIVVDNVLPPGTIQMYVGTTPPPGWMLCQGQVLGAFNTIYSSLFSVIGYTYGGAGNNFLLPDMQQRFPMGANPGVVNPGVGAGANSYVLGQNQIPAHAHLNPHTHGMNHGHDSQKTNTAGSSTSAFAAGVSTGVIVNTAPHPVENLVGSTQGASADTGNPTTGTGAAIDNRPLYTTINFIIKL